MLDRLDSMTTLGKQNIVIEGPIGVGKSSLSRKIVDTFGGRLFLEKPAENPFLERFYQKPKQYSLPTQLYFLMQRVQQLADLNALQAAESGADKTMVVADFMIEKDPLFAQLTLDEEQMDLYQKVFDHTTIDKLVPDLVIYLQAPVKVLQQRIKKRNIKAELNIDNAYLERLCSIYADYFHRFIEAPLLIVNAAEFNPIENDHHFSALMSQVEKIQAGKHFFNPLSI